MTLIERKAKAFDIIKEKRVILLRVIAFKKHRDWYNGDVPIENQLTEDEWNLLVELI